MFYREWTLVSFFSKVTKNEGEEMEAKKTKITFLRTKKNLKSTFFRENRH